MDDRAAKRVALARDVLARIGSAEIQPYFGAYVLIDAAGCKSCALGSMLVACCGMPPHSMASDPRRLVECLVPLFSVEELAIVEAAFEGKNGMPMSSEARISQGAHLDDSDLEQDIDIAADAFGESPDEGDEMFLTSASNRLHDIMSNIIANDGDLCPELL